MSSNGLYNQTTWYFIFKSVVTIISCFISVILLTVYHVDYQNNKYANIASISSTSTTPNHKKKPKLKKYSLIESIIHKLTWCILIIFCMSCIMNSLFMIIEQVGGVSEFQKLLCTRWTVRIISAWAQFAVGLMHCLFISQLHSMYQKDQLTQFAYKSSTLRLWCFVIMNLTVLSTVLLLVFLEVDAFDITFLQNDHSSCNIMVPTFVNVVVGGTEMIIVLCLCYLFLKPMGDMLKMQKSSDIETDFSQLQIAYVTRLSTLALTASITTFASALIIGWTNAIWPLFVSMPLNCICVMFMTDYYPNGYRIVFCLFIRCRTRLFTKDNKIKLRSELVYHVTQESSQHMIALKDVEKETEAYLVEIQKPATLALADTPSYDPYGVGKLDKPDKLDTSYAQLATTAAGGNASTKHEQITTMELKMMDLTPLTTKKQTRSLSSSDKIEIIGNDNKHLLVKKADRADNNNNVAIPNMLSDSYISSDATFDSTKL